MAIIPNFVTGNKYFPYVLEIRKRFLFIGSVFAVASIVGFFLYDKIITFLLKFFSLRGVNIVFTNPFQFFTLALYCGLIVGVIVIIPILVFQLLGFLKPALKTGEYQKIVSILPMALILFAGGFVYGAAMMKFVLQIFYQSSLSLQIGNMLDIEKFLSNIMMTGLLMGIAFLFPIVMTILMLLNIVKYSVFAKQRVYAYLIGVVFVLLLPPPDLVSDIILFTPLAILFELTLILNRVFFKTHLL